MKIATFFLLYGEPIELINRLANKVLRTFFQFVHALRNNGYSHNKIFLHSDQISQEDRQELTLRSEFYLSGSGRVDFIDAPELDIKLLNSPVPIIIFGRRGKMEEWLVRNRPGTFDLDFRINPLDGWDWINLANYFSRSTLDLNRSRQRFIDRVDLLKRESRSKCYLFGTGPSLEKALDRKWDDGYRIVCNTIVRDPVLWEHLNPDFIVAGDAIYHFGHTQFARAFRNDLRIRLETSRTLFLYPSQFHVIVERELGHLQDCLVPIPTGWQRQVSIDLTHSFKLPNLGNVLGLMQLPLACTLSKHVYLWGFDGRAPKDKLFWSNSNKHTYPEYMEELKRSHPRFFDYYVPVSDPSKYTRDYQGDRLETVLQIAEKSGWSFEMMHPSWTPVLQKRYRGEK